VRRVVLESPYSGDSPEAIAANVDYARRCLADSLARGEAPIASHLLHTQPGVLRDEIPEERARGIAAGHAWIGQAHALVVYKDRGVSRGMQAAIRLAGLYDVRIEWRRLERSPIPDPTWRDPATVGPAAGPVGADFHELARARAALADARARLDAVGAVLDNGCDCPCDCPADEHEDDCFRCLACRVESAAFGRGKR
jgi:hypothetical protein